MLFPLGISELACCCSCITHGIPNAVGTQLPGLTSSGHKPRNLARILNPCLILETGFCYIQQYATTFSVTQKEGRGPGTGCMTASNRIRLDATT
jgi:hypothetical protein